MWFFGAYQPALTTIDRSVDAVDRGQPGGDAATSEQKVTIHYMTGNITSQLSDSTRAAHRLQQQLDRSTKASCRR